jgi:hypothetical protein
MWRNSQDRPGQKNLEGLPGWKGELPQPGAKISKGLSGWEGKPRGGSNPGGPSGVGRQGAMVEVPIVVSQVPMVETVELDSQRKSRSVGLGEVARGKLSSSKTTCRETIRQFVDRSRQR